MSGIGLWGVSEQCFEWATLVPDIKESLEGTALPSLSTKTLSKEE